MRPMARPVFVPLIEKQKMQNPMMLHFGLRMAR